MLRAKGIDLFAGAGGTTTGIEQAELEGRKIAEVLACINHDEVAIQSHAANHKSVVHFTEDIRGFQISRLPIAFDSLFSFIWASLECTNFSNAKGGQPRDADSRTLAEYLFAYLAWGPDYVLIENVREFMSWGDLDENGKPVSKDKGRLFIRWVKKVCSYGYHYDYKILNAADYGAYTSRKRLFIIFAKNGLPIVWPETTHAKGGGFGMPKWKAVKEVLDLKDKGESIFGRKKPLSENTYKRIYAGLVKYIAGGDESFLLKWLSNDPKTGSNNGVSIEGPAPVVTTQNRLGLCQPEFLINYQHSSKVNSLEDPSPTITTHDKYAKIHADCFLDMQYSQGQRHQSADEPCGSLLTVPKQKLITAQFLDQQYGQSKPKGLDEPVGALVANPKENLVSAQFLMNTQYSSDGQGLDRPCFTLIARMDKKPPYLVSTELGNIAINVYESDSPMMIKIKQFMAAYGIIDIKMRMLKVPELLKIQGFPEDYKLMGNQSQQKKFIGNAVVPVMSKKLIEALYEANLKAQNEEAA